MRAVLSGRSSTPEIAIVELAVGGMTCAACAAGVQRKLDRLDGVSASVSYATERATVDVARRVSIPSLIEVVEQTGYTARLVTATHQESAETSGADRPDFDRVRDLRRRLMVAVLLSIPLANLSVGWSLVEWIRVPYWQWILVVLAAPIVT